VKIVQSFWFGGELSPYEGLSLKSFLDHGFEFHLYSYENALQVPPGVILKSANEIIPRSQVFALESGVAQGSWSVFSDIFRYQLLFQRGGWWVDTDVVCVKEDFPPEEIVCGLEMDGKINSAIMRFPMGHPAMQECARIAHQIGQNGTWGDTGPTLLTNVIKGHDLGRFVKPKQTFYEINWSEIEILYDPKAKSDLVHRIESASAVHLWNELTRRAVVNKFVGVPEGCLLGELFERHGIAFPDRVRYSPQEIQQLHCNRISHQRLIEAIQKDINRDCI
jgi:hypothetical protein